MIKKRIKYLITVQKLAGALPLISIMLQVHNHERKDEPQKNTFPAQTFVFRSEIQEVGADISFETRNRLFAQKRSGADREAAFLAFCAG